MVLRLLNQLVMVKNIRWAMRSIGLILFLIRDIIQLAGIMEKQNQGIIQIKKSESHVKFVVDKIHIIVLVHRESG